MRENSALKKCVGIWIRVSTEDQARGDSPAVHESRARDVANQRGWNVLELYNLAGVSGKSVMQHKETKRMMADVERGHISGLIFSKIARLSRNVRELQVFGDFFNEKKADLISLSESIDTTTAGGRMFFNMLGSFAQWEREELSDRVNASFKTRAKMGKLLNSHCPYGYKVVDAKLVIHPEESPIRRQAYELFLIHRRKHTVARMLNDKGYRTRKNRLWAWAQIRDMLADSSAKGIHFFNRGKRIGPWKYSPKPESEWGRIECEAIVSENLWNEVNKILEQQSKAWKKPGRLPTQTFSHLAWCSCGGKMYARHDSPKYLCRKCNNKIPIADLENAFHEGLKVYLSDPARLAASLAQARRNLNEKEELLANHKQAIQKVQDDMERVRQLYLEKQIPVKGFGEFYNPLEARLNQLVAEQPNLEVDVDSIKLKELTAGDIVAEAQKNYERWPKLSIDDRRKFAELVCEKIVIGENDLDITWLGRPSSGELCKNQTLLWGRAS